MLPLDKNKIAFYRTGYEFFFKWFYVCIVPVYLLLVVLGNYRMQLNWNGVYGDPMKFPIRNELSDLHREYLFFCIILMKIHNSYNLLNDGSNPCNILYSISVTLDHKVRPIPIRLYSYIIN